MDLMATDDEKTVKRVTRFVIGVFVVVVLVVALGSWASIRQMNNFESDCTALGGHIDTVGSVSICLDPQGRVIDVKRRFN